MAYQIQRLDGEADGMADAMGDRIGKGIADGAGDRAGEGKRSAAGPKDGLAGQWFASYDEAHAVLERFYADLCCSDDRPYYQIVEIASEAER